MTGVAAPTPEIEVFFESVLVDLRRRLLLPGDDGERRMTEDAIALLTDYRLSGMDVQALERLLDMLRTGRSPVALALLRPEALAGELRARWLDYVRNGRTKTAPMLG